MATTPPTFTIHETHDFVRWVRRNRLTTAVNKLKADLHGDPETGAVIPGGGGLRKVRMGGRGRGKRGVFRVIYVLFLEQTASLLLTGYSKSEKEDLSADELKGLVQEQAGIVAILTAQARARQPEGQS